MSIELQEGKGAHEWEVRAGHRQVSLCDQRRPGVKRGTQGRERRQWRGAKGARETGRDGPPGSGGQMGQQEEG